MKERKKGKELSGRFWATVIGICIVMIALVTVGFIIFSNRTPEVVETEEDGGYVTLNYTSEVNALTILGAVPTADAVGMKNMNADQYFDFSVDVDLLDAPKVEYEVSITLA